MKIERIHIDNFGKFSDYTIDFNSGFNLVFGNNEDGKTTLMSFIRLMFYGGGTSKSDLLCNLRRRYTPFSEEKMGGSIEFSHDGKEYLLSKQFGKTPKSDKVLLLNKALGTPIPLASGLEIGEMFFSLSAGAFEKSIYLGSLPPYSEDGFADLEKRLTSAVYTGDNGDGYEQIAKRISAAQNALRTPRKVGKTDKLCEEIHALKTELLVVKTLEEERKKRESDVSVKSCKLEDLEKRQNALQELLKKSRIAEKRAAIKTELDNRKEIDTLSKAVADCSKENLSRAQALYEKHAVLAAKISAFSQGGKPETSDVTAQKAEFENANSKLSKTVADIKVLEEKLLIAEKASSGKETPLLFVAALLFTLSAAFGFFASPVFLLMLLPAIVFFALYVKNAKIKSKSSAEILEIKSQLLALKETELSLKESANRAETALRVQIEHQNMLLKNAQTQNAEKEKLLAEDAQIKDELLDILGVTAEFSKEKIADFQAKHNRLDSLLLLSSQSPFADTDTNELESKFAETADLEGLKTPAEYEKVIADISREINETGITLEREKISLQNILRGKRGIATLERLIDEKNQALSAQNAHYDALTTASDALFAAYTAMRQNFAPELNRITSEIFEGITDGLHTGATVAKDFSVRVSEKGNPLPFESEYLSAGTRDQLDLSLRLSLAKLTAGENSLPLLLDDVLAQYDDCRAKKAIKFLADYGMTNQILFFTCHGDIRNLAQEIGAEIKAL